MQVQQILEQIDQEIARLQQARDLLAGEPTQPRRGRPRGPGRPRKETSAAASNAKSGRSRTMSAEGRQRIAEAMRKRWADRRKSQQ